MVTMVDLGDTSRMTGPFIHSTQPQQQPGEDQSCLPFTQAKKSVAAPILDLRKRPQIRESSS